MSRFLPILSSRSLPSPYIRHRFISGEGGSDGEDRKGQDCSIWAESKGSAGNSPQGDSDPRLGRLCLSRHPWSYETVDLIHYADRLSQSGRNSLAHGRAVGQIEFLVAGRSSDDATSRGGDVSAICMATCRDYCRVGIGTSHRASEAHVRSTSKSQAAVKRCDIYADVIRI